jgi:hypothetical protein
VEEETNGDPGRTAPPQAEPPALPASLKVRHQVNESVWYFEDQDGQLYIAVKATSFQPGLPATYSGQF